MSGRKVVAGVLSVPLGFVTGYFGLLAALVIVQQILAGWIDLSQATWASFLNPAVWIGVQSPGGTGGFWDAIYGGPGAPGGSMMRYFVGAVTFVIAGMAWTGLKALWQWAGSTPTVAVTGDTRAH